MNPLEKQFHQIQFRKHGGKATRGHRGKQAVTRSFVLFSMNLPIEPDSTKNEQRLAEYEAKRDALNPEPVPLDELIRRGEAMYQQWQDEDDQMVRQSVLRAKARAEAQRREYAA